MNIINIEHVSKTFGEQTIFDDISYGIHDGDKIGIIGINGTGKTTLLKIIAGLEEPDEGQVIIQNGLKITYLSQEPKLIEGASVLSCISHKEAHQAKAILNQLGVTDHEALTTHLSGGEKKRVALAGVLVESADVLILDEPTNHIDNEMASWLEDYLNKFKGVVIMVTHDRYFLERVANKILEIDHGKLYSYTANYSRFLEMKAQREEMELASNRKRQSMLHIELKWAMRGCRARSTKQKARLMRLEALKSGALPAKEQNIEIDSIETRTGKKTIELNHISKSYGAKKLIDDFTYIVLKNQRLGIIGPNGCGKSTLLKIINQTVKPDSGNIEIGETIRIGYFGQETRESDVSKRVIDYIRDVAEYIPTKDGKITASQMIERFLFDSSMQYTQVAKLSGGEKRRLSLMKVLMEAPNVLLLDEPSNDLDIPTLTILEDYLSSFSGIVIAVSHDRYFLDNIADRIFAFEGNGHLKQYEGGYMDYVEARAALAALVEGEERPLGKTASVKKKSQGKEWRKNRSTELKFSYKEQKEYETIDDDIAVLEERVRVLEKEMDANANQYTTLYQLAEEKENADKLLEEKIQRWVYLNDLAERIKMQSQKGGI